MGCKNERWDVALREDWFEVEHYIALRAWGAQRNLTMHQLANELSANEH